MSDDTLWYNNMLAVGIFPQGDITEHYNMMYYGAEDGFKRDTFGQRVGVIRYNEDPDYYVEAGMGEQSKVTGYVRQHRIPHLTMSTFTLLGKPLSKE